jgi:hypothetical protein
MKMLRRGRQNQQEAVENSSSNGGARLEKKASSETTGAPWKVPLLLLIILIISCCVYPRDSESNQAERPVQVTAKLPPTLSIAADEHLFDCQHVNATCHYFRPLSFFQHGNGQAYFSILTELGAESVNLPRMTHFSRGTELALTTHYNETSADDSRHPLFGYLPTDVTFFHLRKTGGTTIHHAIGNLVKYIKSRGGVAQVKRHSTCRSVLRDKCLAEAHQHLNQIYNHQQEESTLSKHVVFAVVRDPVSRFLSAMGQAMADGPRLRDLCLDETSANTTIKCVLQHLQEHGLKTDVHFCPMAVNLYVLMRNLNVQVALFEKELHLESLLVYFGTSSHLHMRDRSKAEYTNSELLSQLSVKDLDDSMIRVICELYQVDVVMMKSIGLDVPLCGTNRSG